MDPRDSIDAEIAALLPWFLAESEEGLTRMEEVLMLLERHPGDLEALGDAFRVMHTLKGNAAIMKLPAIANLGHAAEELLDRLRDGSLRVTGSLITLLLRTVDTLREMLSAAADGRATALTPPGSLLEGLTLAATGKSAPTAPAPTAGARPETLELEPPSGEKPRIVAAQGTTGSLRVDLDKLDRLLDLAGELSIARGRLARTLENPERSRTAAREILQEADGPHLEFQDLVTTLRMVPIGPIFRRYRRTVRDLARTLGKQARLVIEGEDIEVDATVLGHLQDPLNHIVRNALEHGIEAPDARSAAGKDRQGLVKLEARHEAGSIVIELSDDGAGLDRRGILEQDRAAGLANEVSDLSDQQILDLVFAPGFSATGAAADLSARGTGLDVLRRYIEELRGSVTLTSRRGEGTTVTVQLPLTLAIVDGLTVEVAGEIFFVPLARVVEAVELPPEERHDDHGSLDLRGRSLPYLRLRRFFGLGDGTPARRENVVVVRNLKGQLAGLVVDALHGQIQAVLKPLAKLFRGLPGFSGSTILSNGSVALILDVPGLLRHCVKSEIADDSMAAGGARP